MVQEAGFARDDLEQAFSALGEKARAEGKIVEIAVMAGLRWSSPCRDEAQPKMSMLCLRRRI